MRKVRWRILESVLGRRRPGPAPPSKVIVGLGNPGEEYSKTRHNVGFWCVEHLARESSISFSIRRRQAIIGEGVIGEIPVALAKPRSFVNNSGEAVGFLLARYKTQPADLLVVYDDLDLSPGTLRIRATGGSGGHNGMKSIIEAAGTQDIPRVRIGIGRPPADVDEVDYVLGEMSPEEQSQADASVERAAQAAVCVLTEGIDAAMDRFN